MFIADITVWDAVHANGTTPISTTIKPFGQVAIYFSDDSASFNAENATDFAVATPTGNFKRHFEIYVDSNGSNFTQERGRITLNGTATPTVVNGVTLFGYGTQLNKLDIVTISPKLRGYQFGTVTKITLNMTSFVGATGVYSGNLASFDGINFTHVGPTTTGKVGEVTRFYDETSSDYIEINFATNVVISDFTNQQIDFQLFPTLQLDTQFLFLGTCQVNDTLQQVSKIVDRRQFGNISEKDLSTSVFDFMSVPEKYFHSNGIVRGFDIPTVNGIFSGGSKGIINLAGGVVLVNGKIFRINNETIQIPIVKEFFGGTTFPVDWLLCVNDIGEYVLVPQLDFDSTLGTPNAPTRTFTAKDFVSSNTYAIPAITLSDLVNRRPDLTVLYQVSTVITGVATTPIVTITVQDFRKFAYKRDWGQVPSLNVDANNGDFRSFASLGNWFSKNSGYSNTVYARGTFTTFPTNLTFTSGAGASLYVKFLGDGTTTFSPTTTFIASVVEFDNIIFTGTLVEFAGCNLNNCTISPSTVLAFVTSGSFTNNITNSTINVSGPGAVGTLASFANTTFTNVTFNINGTSTTTSFNSGCIFNNCIFNFAGGSQTVSFTGLATSLDIIQGCVVNFNAGSTLITVNSVAMTDTDFNWISSGAANPVNLNGNYFAVNNCSFNANIMGGAVPAELVQVLAGANGIITGNSFFRGSTALTTGYILAPASGFVTVTNNFFDNPTIDGTNQNLIKNLPATWIYQNNLNTPTTIPTNTTATGNAITPYNVQVTDDIILLTPQAAMTVNLPQISLSPPGRTFTIKDVTGVFDTKPVTLHRAVITETIEGIAADYVFNMPYGSLTLVATATGWTIV